MPITARVLKSPPTYFFELEVSDGQRSEKLNLSYDPLKVRKIRELCEKTSDTNTGDSELWSVCKNLAEYRAVQIFSEGLPIPIAAIPVSIATAIQDFFAEDRLVP